ncbi:MAG: PH domain-containing protein [Anaerovoracaceae bacterium]
MEYRNLDVRVKKAWVLSRIGGILIIAIITVILKVLDFNFEFNLIGNTINGSKAITGFFVLLLIYKVIGVIIYPKIEYKQWKYMIGEDKVEIQHGIFYIKHTVIPIIKIQHITMTQGIIFRANDIMEVDISLASGSFSITGLSIDDAREISENLKNKIYLRDKYLNKEV